MCQGYIWDASEAPCIHSSNTESQIILKILSNAELPQVDPNEKSNTNTIDNRLGSDLLLE